MTIFTSLIAGLVFGLGLIVSGMANPAKILGFLDVAGAWDPSLLLVMGGAVAVASVAFAIARKRTVSLLGAEMKLPTARQIDRRLVGGSLLFGIGWGIAGFCPGPVVVAPISRTGRSRSSITVVAAMLVGMGGFELLERRKPNSPIHAT